MSPTFILISNKIMEDDDLLADIEDDEVTETQVKGRQTDHLKPWQFKPGQSGNPGGMKPGTVSMKTWAKNYLSNLDEEERLEFMKGMNKTEVWKMAEGNPAQDITSGGEKLIPTPILGGITNAVQTDNSPEKDTVIEKKS